MARWIWLGAESTARTILLSISLLFVGTAKAPGGEPDRLKAMQTEYVANSSEQVARAYHFGSQGPGDIFSNHTSHSNRLVAIYLFGRKGDL
ncbi:MAG: hypothetical protein ACYC61_21420, partial [Isosphaeraceae bacterium]